MKKIVEDALVKKGALITSAALFAGKDSANSKCIWLFGQPKVPAGMKKFVKEK